jgi:hypothetical protein
MRIVFWIFDKGYYHIPMPRGRRRAPRKGGYLHTYLPATFKKAASGLPRGDGFAVPFLTSFRVSVSYVVILHMTTLSRTMAALRASFTIAPEVLLKFNEMVPAGERSQVIQSLMQKALAERQKRLEAIAEEFDTHPDFKVARRDASAFETTVADGLDK